MAITFAGAALLVSVHTAVKDEIDGGGAAGYIDIYDSSDTLLSTLPLDYPCGTVNGTTGQLTIDFGARDDEAAATGTADYGVVKDSAGTTLITLDCAEGTSAVADTLVLSSLSIVAGAPVEGVSFTIG